MKLRLKQCLKWIMSIAIFNYVYSVMSTFLGNKATIFNYMPEKLTHNQYFYFNGIQDRFKQNNKRLVNEWLINVNKGLLIDWWDEICIKNRELKNVVWHPLFPEIPGGSLVANNKSHTSNSSYLKRHYGYILSKQSSVYDFKIWAKQMADVVVIEMNKNIPRSNKDLFQTGQINLVLHMQCASNLNGTCLKPNVVLEPNQMYYIEILSVDYFKMQWRETHDQDFIDISQYYHTDHLKTGPKMSVFKNTVYKMLPRFPVMKEEAIRMAFNEHPVLNIENSAFKCPPAPNIVLPIKKLYDGYLVHLRYLYVVTYPKEHFKHTEKYPSLDTAEAVDISNKVFMKLKRIQKSISLENLVHIQSNYDRDFRKFKDYKKTYYFLELDVKGADNNTFRTSHFVKLLPDGDICFMTDYKWKPGVTINLLTPLKNQKPWFQFTIRMLEELITKNKEVNVNWIVVDYSSNTDHEKLLNRSKLKYHYTNCGLKGEQFSKVKALNHGIRQVKDDASIIFVLDLHLQLPTNIFDRIRKLTIRGKTAFTPSLMRQHCGEHEQYTDIVESFWVDNGPGMIAMYKSDFDKIGGYNEKLYGSKWGGEDWEILDRILANGLYVIKQRMQRFYHIYHSRKSMWNK